MADVASNYYIKHRDHIRLTAKHRRRTNVAATILEDCRKADRKHGRVSDLDVPFIQAAIEKPCSYCGETQIRMTLDRIDNAIGHVKCNVVSACERCNYARRDMPYTAWLLVAKAMGEAREQGLFGAWTGGIHRRNSLARVPLLPTREPPAHGTIAGYHKCGPPRCEECRRAMRDYQRNRRSK